MSVEQYAATSIKRGNRFGNIASLLLLHIFHIALFIFFFQLDNSCLLSWSFSISLNVVIAKLTIVTVQYINIYINIKLRYRN